jgi:hypothetical protein
MTAPLRIVHDPESGCTACRLCVDEMGAHCAATGEDLDPRAVYSARPVPAPAWCPLRSGGVVVVPPSHEDALCGTGAARMGVGASESVAGFLEPPSRSGATERQRAEGGGEC